ncbi:MAG: hypothetical protein HHJ12_13295 [Glaciimonas sp.]|nr:hypothetical protein [Glaciimonas sp.]
MRIFLDFDTSIDSNTSIGSNTNIDSNTSIGSNTNIDSNTSIGSNTSANTGTNTVRTSQQCGELFVLCCADCSQRGGQWHHSEHTSRRLLLGNPTAQRPGWDCIAGCRQR